MKPTRRLFSAQAMRLSITIDRREAKFTFRARQQAAPYALRDGTATNGRNCLPCLLASPPPMEADL
jgi:hypothetical protein